MRCLPPVVAPILNDFAWFAVIENKMLRTAALPSEVSSRDDLLRVPPSDPLRETIYGDVA